jgi:plasmid replication initiation protein
MPQSSLSDHKQLVVKANDLIRGKANWTKLEHRVFAMMVAQLRKDDDEFRPQKIYVKDLLELSDTDYGALYERLEDVCQKLVQQSIAVRDHVDGNRRRYTAMSPVEYAQYVEGEGYILAKFSESMKPFLLQLKGRFTMYRLRQFMPLRSQYSMRIYELVMMRADLKYLRISVEELREMLHCEEKYDRFIDFKRRVLEVACDEINQKTEESIGFNVERKGQTATHINFHIGERTRLSDHPDPQARSRANTSPTRSGSGRPNIDVRELVVSDLTGQELDRFSDDQIDEAVAAGRAHARQENTGASSGNRAVAAYRHAVHLLRTQSR